ncbi:hypothetical protein PILCRDRAFT_827630 [Piloderma croceum F 1598]|uniref:Uncharacterized protein n=1 Tax=Piloderma croceum (strain F 1598) TaxID=765440 RepID=A0A0C3F4S9_PILCF|nr:hypothetical protein PILCRDRAFT_827630 [Piloderma croceum F 1598]
MYPSSTSCSTPHNIDCVRIDNDRCQACFAGLLGYVLFRSLGWAHHNHDWIQGNTSFPIARVSSAAISRTTELGTLIFPTRRVL